MSVRKFVGYVRVAAVAGSVFALGLSTSTAAATTSSTPPAGAAAFVAHHTNLTLPAPSAACVAAFQTIKTWFANDRSEDAAERANTALEAGTAADQTEDAAEHAQLKALFAAAHTACAAEIAAIKARIATKVAAVRSPSCTSAMAALKAEMRNIWSQGSRPTSAQIADIRALKAAAANACGWHFCTHR